MTGPATKSRSMKSSGLPSEVRAGFSGSSSIKGISLPHPPTFRPLAYRTLVKSLGESDAAVEWIEVGVRELCNLEKTQGFKFIEDLAETHGVRVNKVAMSEVRGQCARLELLAVYQQADNFFRLFRKHHPRVVSFSRDSDDDVLTATLEAFKVKVAQVGQLEHDLFQYYRGARNLIMHDPAGEQRKTHKRSQATLLNAVKQSAYSALNAPNVVEQFAFDDFMLFTRALKQLAANLCEATNPTDEELASAALAEKPLMGKLRSLGERSARREQTVAGFLRERYSVPAARAQQVASLVLSTAR
jgi:hypothetical protein